MDPIGSEKNTKRSSEKGWKRFDGGGGERLVLCESWDKVVRRSKRASRIPSRRCEDAKPESDRDIGLKKSSTKKGFEGRWPGVKRTERKSQSADAWSSEHETPT